MALVRTAKGSTYRCQGRFSYAMVELIGAVAALSGGVVASAAGRWYVVEARLAYAGSVGFRCTSKLDFRVHDDRIARYSPALQGDLMASYMDLRVDAGTRPPDLRLEKALLPLMGSIAHAHVVARPGGALSIEARRSAGWEIPEHEVDDLFARMVREGERLRLALAAIDSFAADG